VIGLEIQVAVKKADQTAEKHEALQRKLTRSVQARTARCSEDRRDEDQRQGHLYEYLIHGVVAQGIESIFTFILGVEYELSCECKFKL
jgi:hypothetical protein